MVLQETGHYEGQPTSPSLDNVFENDSEEAFWEVCHYDDQPTSTSANSSLDLWAGYYEGQPTSANSSLDLWAGYYEGQPTSAKSSLDLWAGHYEGQQTSTSANPSLDLWAGHYEGQPTSTSTSSSLADVFGNVNISEEALKWAMTIYPKTYCLWWEADSSLPCCKLISPNDVPEHFRRAHGIKNKGRKEEICCRWDNCEAVITRHNFVRHIREFHLGSERP